MSDATSDGRQAAFSYLDGLIRHSTNPTLLTAAQAVKAEMLAQEAAALSASSPSAEQRYTETDGPAPAGPYAAAEGAGDGV